MKEAVVIGTFVSDDGTSNQLLAGNTDKQQIWVDYIQAHNDRDLKKIAEINADELGRLRARRLSYQRKRGPHRMAQRVVCFFR